MRHYEIVALVHPDQSVHIEDIVARYRKIIENSGGKVHRYENWGRRKLAYPINKVYKAGYFLLNVECEPKVKDEIENAFRYYDSIIRSIFIRLDQAVTSQSPIMKKLMKQEEEERAAEEKAFAELEQQRLKESKVEASVEPAATARVESAKVDNNSQEESLAAASESEDAATENDDADNDDTAEDVQAAEPVSEEEVKS